MIIKKSFNAVNKVFGFVIFYYLFVLYSSFIGAFKPPILVSMLLLGFYLIIQCGVMGVISRAIAGEGVNLRSSIVEIKFTFFRYLGALLILGLLVIICSIPILTIFSIIKGSNPIAGLVNTASFFIVINSFMLVVGILTIFMFPFVFLKGKGADAFIEGVKYLFKNLKNSTVLIIVDIIKTVISTSVLIFALRFPQSSFQNNAIEALNSFVIIYIDLMIFAGACYILRTTDIQEIRSKLE